MTYKRSLLPFPGFCRCADHHNWSMLVSSLALLAECDLSHDNFQFLTQQFVYLAQSKDSFYKDQHGQDRIEAFDNSLPLLSPPPQISKKLWKELQKLPLSEGYHKKVLESVFTHCEFWKKVCTNSLEEKESLLAAKDIFSLPWRSQEGGEDVDMCCLNDYVLLRFLSEEAYLESMRDLSSTLTSSISVPVLADLLLQISHNYIPCLIFYNEACSRSQAVLQSLEDSIKKAVKVCKIKASTCGYPMSDKVDVVKSDYISYM